MTPKTMLRFERVNHEFRNAHAVQVLHDVSLDVATGSITAIVGPSGSGKTTLLTLAGGFERPTSGRIHVSGVALDDLSQRGLGRFRRRMVGFVFQDFKLIDVLTALDNVSLSLRIRGVRRKAARLASAALLDELGLEHAVNRYPRQLSGGEKQRVAIARALAPRPSLVLADEPTANLDWESGSRAVALLREAVRNRDATALIVSHDPRIEHFADKVVRLLDGRIVSNRKTRDAA